MPRLRGPLAALPEGETAWAMLNTLLYGRNDRGGYDTPMRPEILPVDWHDVFGRTAPRALEIGFNRGAFLTELARLRPERDHIGIEVSRRFVWRLAQIYGAAPDSPRNVRIVWADARAAAPVLFAPGSLEAIYINFPDPWWKNRHHKRRLVQGTFAQELADMLAPGGRVWIKSDVPEIAGEIDEALAAVPTLGDKQPFAAEALPFTWRERRCVAKAMPITRFSYGRCPPT